MYDFLTLNTTKTQEKYKYLPKNIHFIVLHQPKRHKKSDLLVKLQAVIHQQVR